MPLPDDEDLECPFEEKESLPDDYIDEQAEQEENDWADYVDYKSEHS